MNSTGQRPGEGFIVLRFLASPTDVADLGGTAVSGGRVLEWIDRAAYACAVGWSSAYSVTAYVGDVVFDTGINTGDLVEVSAQLVLTRRSSMHIKVTVSAGAITADRLDERASCIVVFIALDPVSRRPTQVRSWEPSTARQRGDATAASERIGVRKSIETAMAEQTYSAAGTAPEVVLRFLAAPTDVNWGGKTHGGTVMHWIEDAASVCARRWTGQECLAIYCGGIRFYRPVLIGNLVEVTARLLHTGRTSMHIAVHVRSADPKTGDYSLTTHCLTVFVAIAEGSAVVAPTWHPHSDEDRRLDTHAQELMRLRARSDVNPGPDN
ncbi:MAG: hotdog domain-containing protein [Ornithinimicrobium sp.]